jgi:hypothetical protein
MGFFDAIKSAVNVVTGGAAKVTMELGTPTQPGLFPVIVKAAVAGTDLKIAKVYLRVESVETVTLRNKQLAGDSKPHDIQETENAYTLDVTVSGEQTLAANKEFEWTAQFQLPTDAPRTYRGKIATNEWRVYAALDATGTDPACSWVPFEYR